MERNPGNFVSNFIPLWVRHAAAPHPAVYCQCCPQRLSPGYLLALEAPSTEHYRLDSELYTILDWWILPQVINIASYPTYDCHQSSVLFIHLRWALRRQRGRRRWRPWRRSGARGCWVLQGWRLRTPPRGSSGTRPTHGPPCRTSSSRRWRTTAVRCTIRAGTCAKRYDGVLIMVTSLVHCIPVAAGMHTASCSGFLQPSRL